jgi:SLT domain-containing protein
VVLGQFGAYNENFGPINEQLKLAQLAQGDITAKMAKIKEDQEKILKDGADPLLAKQAVLIDTQINANEALKKFIADGIGPAQDKMILLAEATAWAAAGLLDLFGKKDPEEEKRKNAEVMQTQQNAVGRDFKLNKDEKKAATMQLETKEIGGVELSERDKKWLEQRQAQPRAAGGPVDAGKLYKVGEQGEEFFKPKVAGEIIPNNKLAGMTSGNNMANLAAGMTSGNNMDNPAASDTIKSLVASLTVVSKSMTTGSREMDDAFDEIVKDSVKLERLTDADTKRAEKYSIAYKSYVDLKTQLMDLETPDLKSQIDILQQKALQTSTTAGGAATPGSGAPGGTGLKLPTAGSMPAMGGGQGVAGGIASQNDLTKMGLKLKTGDVQAEGSKIDPKIIDLAQQVQANMPNFAYFSGFNDKFHQEKSPSSSHTTGRAMDFALSKQPSVEEGKEITNWLKSMGASVAIDEYNNPSAKATAGHIHAQIPGYADGGLASTPQIAMVAEKGPEAMIPLDNGAIPINLEMPDVKKMFEGMMQSMKDVPEREVTAVASSDNRAMTELVNVMREQTAELINAMSEMIREQKNSISVQERILQTSM